MQILLAAGAAGAWVALEHPRDWGAPFPSIWASPWVLEWIRLIGVTLHHCDQCVFGCTSRKPTTFGTDDPSASILDRSCNHRDGHVPAVGRSASGGWRTTPLANYPPALCDALASLIVDACGNAVRNSKGTPFDKVELPRTAGFSHRVAALFIDAEGPGQI